MSGPATSAMWNATSHETTQGPRSTSLRFMCDEEELRTILSRLSMVEHSLKSALDTDSKVRNLDYDVKEAIARGKSLEARIQDLEDVKSANATNRTRIAELGKRTCEVEARLEKLASDIQPKPEDPIMPADTTPSTAALGLSEIKTAITEGAKDGAAVLASNTMVALLYKLPIAEKFPEAMRTEMGRKVVQAILPFLVYLIATLAPAYVPSAERVKAVSVRAIRGNTILFAASLAMFMDMFRELASIDTEAP